MSTVLTYETVDKFFKYVPKDQNTWKQTTVTSKSHSRRSESFLCLTKQREDVWGWGGGGEEVTALRINFGAKWRRTVRLHHRQQNSRYPADTRVDVVGEESVPAAVGNQIQVIPSVA
jgi:hypothetical protein